MRISHGVCAFAAWIAAGTAAFAAQAPAPRKLTPEQQAYVAKVERIAKTIHPQFGDVKIGIAGTTLHLGKDYYFIPADQARSVIVDAWGNMPEQAANVRGMIFPAGKNFASDSWAAVITYDPSGYVSDGDAASTDYGDMLKQAREGEDERNMVRKQKGYEPIHLVGWAQPPYYDKAHHTLVWARDLKFGDARDDTLNYDLRALGRHGVLSMNIVSTMSRLGEVRAAAAKLQNIGTFDGGQRYQDYKQGTDKVAEYGVGGLVAAGVGVVLAKKLGLLAVGLVFVKKFFAIILAGFAGVGAWLKKVFAGRKAV